MKTVENHDFSYEDYLGTCSCIEYHGPNPEQVAQDFEKRYGAKVVLVKEDNSLIIEATDEIEKDFCYSDEGLEEACLEMGLHVDDFWF